MKAIELFNKVIHTIPFIPFNKDWANSTGYFDFACTDEEISKSNNIKTGDMFWSQDEIGRKIILKCIAPDFYIVVFVRTLGKDVLVSNQPSHYELSKKGVNPDVLMHMHGALDLYDLQVFLGLRILKVILNEEGIKQLKENNAPYSIINKALMDGITPEEAFENGISPSLLFALYVEERV